MLSSLLERPRVDIVPKRSEVPGAAKRVRSLLRRGGFTFQAATERLGIDYRMWSGTTATCDKVKTYLSKQPVDRLDVFLRFFVFSVPFQPRILQQWLSQSDIDLLCDIKLVVVARDGRLVSPLSLFECCGQFIVTDAITEQTEDFNFVVPLLPEAYEFAASVIRDRVGATLDLCTGSGVHALLAAKHSGAVRGVDISPRAIAFSRFNQWLNDIQNASFDEGDLFSPLQGETFDLILANPPYEPVPATESSPGDNYYCGGPIGSALTSRIFENLGRFLRPNGVCHVIHMMVSWDHSRHERRIREWLGDIATECNIIVLSRPIGFRCSSISDATAVDFGITSIKRKTSCPWSSYSDGQFSPGCPIDLAARFAQLELECGVSVQALA